MGHHLTARSHRRMLTSHLLLAAVLAGVAALVLHWPSLWREIGVLAGGAIALHAGLAIAVHVAGGSLGFASLAYALAHRK